MLRNIVHVMLMVLMIANLSLAVIAAKARSDASGSTTGSEVAGQ